MEEHYVPIVVAIVGFLGICITALTGMIRVYGERNKTLQAEQEMRFQRAALEFPDFVEEWGEIDKSLVELMENTDVDRFIILRAWNGHLEPRWTTAVYQVRSNGHKPIAYVHFELDQDYVGRLRKTIDHGYVYVETKDMPDSFIADAYNSEKVKAALWCHLSTFKLTGTESQAITYCSFATHSGEELDADTQTKCRILASRLKGLASSFTPEM